MSDINSVATPDTPPLNKEDFTDAQNAIDRAKSQEFTYQLSMVGILSLTLFTVNMLAERYSQVWVAAVGFASFMAIARLQMHVTVSYLNAGICQHSEQPRQAIPSDIRSNELWLETWTRVTVLALTADVLTSLLVILLSK